MRNWPEPPKTAVKAEPRSLLKKAALFREGGPKRSSSNAGGDGGSGQMLKKDGSPSRRPEERQTNAGGYRGLNQTSKALTGRKNCRNPRRKHAARLREAISRIMEG